MAEWERRRLPQLAEDQVNLECGLARYGTALPDKPPLELGPVVLEHARRGRSTAARCGPTAPPPRLAAFAAAAAAAMSCASASPA